ncbi:S8 family peptidase [Priestia megaterium]|uniref:S8 family peptidase n=1 Tax=Priestia megaterium TaxID=1404 RepID=UPI00207A9210|nr:S8 family peptidase [Priestia megaterium]USL45763.1 S8 family peptidase [Priestia megaterium]
MQWLETHKNRMDSSLFQNLSDKFRRSQLDVPNTTQVLIKTKPGTNLRKILDLCSLDSRNSEGHNAPLLNFLSAKLSFQTIQTLVTHPEIEKLYLDKEVHAFLDVASESVGGAYVRNTHGLSGNGVTIAVLDTGIHPHPDFTLPTSRIVDFVDYIQGKSSPYDDNGHGTHVTGCAAGNGFASNGKYTGLAPNAQIIGIKVLDKNGNGYLSSVIAGINYCIENKSRFNIRIINLSFGTDSVVPYIDDPLAQAAEQAVLAGIIVLMAANNSGATGTVNSPATHPKVISVGAVADRKTMPISDGLIYIYTSNLETMNGLMKPDVLLPGVYITGPLPPNSILSDQLEPFVVNQHYISLSGTSIATGLCTGAVAIILEAYPSYSPSRIKDLMLQFRKEFTSEERYFQLPQLFQLILKE